MSYSFNTGCTAKMVSILCTSFLHARTIPCTAYVHWISPGESLSRTIPFRHQQSGIAEHGQYGSTTMDWCWRLPLSTISNSGPLWCVPTSNKQDRDGNWNVEPVNIGAVLEGNPVLANLHLVFQYPPCALTVHGQS